MPEYLAPGVYIEEVSFRAKTIEGVSTSTAGFVGPARYGPTSGEPELLTSFADFERIYGGLDPLEYGGAIATNFLAHGVRAFFEEGGRRLYVARVEAGDGVRATADNQAIVSPPPARIDINARFPGRAGNMRVTFILRRSDNLLVNDPTSDPPVATIRRVQQYDTVVVTGAGSPPSVTLYDVVRSGDELALQEPGGGVEPFSSFDPASQQVFLLTVDVAIERPITRPRRPRERYTLPEVLEGFSLHPRHGNALTTYFDTAPTSRRLALVVPFAIEPATAEPDTGAGMAVALLGAGVIEAAVDDDSSAAQQQRVYRLEGGTDGTLPAAGSYRGASNGTAKSGLAAFEDLEDISIVAAPGYSRGYATANPTQQSQIRAIQAHLIAHCERMRYRIAVLDSPDGQTVGEVRTFRGQVDSTHAAMYYPWVRVVDPVTEDELPLPPSGFVAGIYARSDIERGVHKAPANETVRGGAALLAQCEQGRAGRAQPGRRQLPALLRGPRLPGVGRPHHQLRPGMDLHQRPPAVHLPGTLHRPQHPVGGVRAQQRRAVAQDPPHHRGLPVRRVAHRRPARLAPRRRLLRALRPHHHEPVRSRQRPSGVPDRRRAHQAGRVRDLPHRSMDG
jgi:hypothetical protein